MPFAHDGSRGIADFLVRVVDDEGVVTYEPVNAKLARREAKPGHVLELCFYADAIEASTGRRPSQMHLWLGSGVQETLRVEDFGAYWRRLRLQLSTVMVAEVEKVDTSPEPCNHCTTRGRSGTRTNTGGSPKRRSSHSIAFVENRTRLVSTS